MCTAYIDESGQPRGGAYLVLGALASTAAKWESLEGEWQAAKHKYGFPRDGNGEYLPYHCTDVFSPDSDLSMNLWPVRIEKKLALHKTLIDIMVEHVATTAFTAILHEPYKRVLSKDAKNQSYVYPVCGLGVASRLHRWALRYDKRLDYVFERARGVNQGDAINAIQDLSEVSGDSLMIGSVTSACKGLPSLDAADIWCHELKRHINSAGINPSPSLLALSGIQQQCGFVLGNDLEPFMVYLKEHHGSADYHEVPIQAHPVPIPPSVFKAQS